MSPIHFLLGRRGGLVDSARTSVFQKQQVFKKEKSMKKFVILLSVVCLFVGFVACGESGYDVDDYIGTVWQGKDWHGDTITVTFTNATRFTWYDPMDAPATRTGTWEISGYNTIRIRLSPIFAASGVEGTRFNDRLTFQLVDSAGKRIDFILTKQP